MTKFDTQIKSWLRASEGGFVNHPDDPGGATNMGITFNTLKAWRGEPITMADSMQNRKSRHGTGR